MEKLFYKLGGGSFGIQISIKNINLVEEYSRKHGCHVNF
jgi:hypothetical protein